MDAIRIGIVTKPQGVRGELKIQPLTDDPARFEGLACVFVERGGAYTEMKVESASLRGKDVYVKLAGLDERTAAEQYRGLYLCVDKKDAIPLPEGRYFISDLVGCAVSDSSGEEIGVLREVLELPANHVYVIKGRRSCMVPALKALLQSVDVQQKRIVLNAAVLEQVAVFDEG